MFDCFHKYRLINLSVRKSRIESSKVYMIGYNHNFDERDLSSQIMWKFGRKTHSSSLTIVSLNEYLFIVVSPLHSAVISKHRVRDRLFGSESLCVVN